MNRLLSLIIAAAFAGVSLNAVAQGTTAPADKAPAKAEKKGETKAAAKTTEKAMDKSTDKSKAPEGKK